VLLSPRVRIGRKSDFRARRSYREDVKILIVDDDPAILKLCATVLRADGHDVVTCGSGAPALQATLRGEFDLALCDLNLPDIHGLEVVRAIKMMAPQLPVIAMSALDAALWAEAAQEAGASHFLAKPLRLDVLRGEVDMVERARALLYVVIADTDAMHAARLAHAFMGSGCHVTPAHTAQAIAAALERTQRPNLVIVAAALPGATDVVRTCALSGIACFVIVEPGHADDPLLRAGASLIVKRPVDADALLAQARFLAFG
jgi:DNA-binding response OmpR family regulator